LSTNAETFDLVIVGGGPAGAALGAVVARAGHSVLLLERDRFPRYQIGESLLPATVRQVADVLGVRDRLRDAGFVVKRGATFSWGTVKDTLWTMNFGRVPPGQLEPPPDAPTSFNVPRHEFDQILLENAAAQGVDVREGCTVTDTVSTDGTITGARYVDPSGVSHEVKARFVAITAGQLGLAPRMLGEREYSSFFRKIAVFGYFEGGGRLAPPLHGNVLFETVGDSWLWYIPLSDQLTSVGAVIPFGEAAAVRKDPRAALAGYIRGCPLTSEMLRDAVPSTRPLFAETRMRSEYSYCTTRFWAPGVVAIGDAACFVDVLLSSGVHLATYGALLAGRSINAVLDGRLGEEHAMNEYETRLRVEYATFYRGLVGLYDMHADADSYVTWLRTLLQDTNGVFVEWREQPRAGAADDAGELLERSRSNVATMRAFNTRQVRYAGGPGMTSEAVVPAVSHTLSASGDWLSWNALVNEPQLQT
jgi:halogenation protein CepH